MSRNRKFLIGGLLLALLLACGVSYYASSSPDGLAKVATEQGIDKGARDHDLDGSPLAGYGTEGVDNAWVSKAIAGASGVLLTLAIGGGLFFVVSRSARKRDAGSPVSTQ